MIINSLLDIDFYKYTMGQFAWKYYPTVYVKYAFINRTDIDLPDHIHIDDLIKELDNVRNLKLTLEEINYLNSLGLFSKKYLNFLSNLRLPPVYVSVVDGRLEITTEGMWCQAIFWETLILSIVNELYHKSFTNVGYLGGFEENLEKKIKKIKANPFKFVEFGTRRRFSKEIQDRLLDKMIHSYMGSNTLIGTSNVALAKEYNLTPVGTMAHELPMVCAGLNDRTLSELKGSHGKMLSQWYYLYGNALSIALTDTFGTDFFFKHFTVDKAKNWKGLRQDSGDPIEFMKKACKFYKNLKIKPEEKVIVFSDGLTIDKIYEIEKEAKKNGVNAIYGWGTNLTNDVGYNEKSTYIGKPLSIVVKAVEANGRPLVKLSDNINKAIGKFNIIEKYKRAFGYESTYEEPVYY